MCGEALSKPNLLFCDFVFFNVQVRDLIPNLPKEWDLLVYAASASDIVRCGKYSQFYHIKPNTFAKSTAVCLLLERQDCRYQDKGVR